MKNESPIIECWDAGGTHAYLYTNDGNLAKSLIKEFGSSGVYYFRGRVAAWQFKIPKRMVEFLKMRVAKQP